MNIKLVMIPVLIALGIMIGIASCYFYHVLTNNYQQGYTASQHNQTYNQPQQKTTDTAKTSSDTTLEISNELQATPDDSSLDAEMKSLETQVQAF